MARMTHRGADDEKAPVFPKQQLESCLKWYLKPCLEPMPSNRSINRDIGISTPPIHGDGELSMPSIINGTAAAFSESRTEVPPY